MTEQISGTGEITETTPQDVESWRNSWVPTKYKPEYDDLLLEHLSKGYSLGSFDVPGGVSYRTLINWTQAHPSFKHAREIGEKRRLKLIEEEGLKMIKAGNVVAWKAVRQEMGIVDKIEVANAGPMETLVGGPDSIRFKRLEKLKLLHEKVTKAQKEAEKSGAIVEGEVVDPLEDL